MFKQNSIEINNEKYIIRNLNIKDKNIIQKLCEDCTDYYNIVSGEEPKEDTWKEILEDLPPNKTYEEKYVLGIFKDKNLVAIVDLVRDYPDKGEWIFGLLLIHPRERRKGLGEKINGLISNMVKDNKGTKLRIGVVEDNSKALNFWRNIGYLEVKRVNLTIGNKENIVIVMNHSVV